MPPVVAPLVALVSSIKLASVVTFAAKIAVFAVVGRLLTPKPKRPNAGAEINQDRAVVVRSTTEPHRIIYGRVITSGTLAYFETGGATRELAYLIVVVAGHQVAAIERFWLDDKEVGERNVAGGVTTGRFANHVVLQAELGSPTQVANATLVAASAGKWTSSDRLRGRAYLYLRLLRSDTVFPTGLPNVRCEVKGRLCHDPRDGVSRWTMNPALIMRDILKAEWGLGALDAEIDDTLVSAAANVCDERVTVSAYTSSAITANATTDRLTFASTEIRFGWGDGVRIASTGTLPGGLAALTTYYVIPVSPTVIKLATSYANALAGTAIDITSAGTGTITLSHIDQVRYTCNASFTRNTAPKEMLEAVAATMAGPAPIFREGKWRIYAGAWVTPTVTLTESDLRGEVVEQVRPPRQQLFNAVRGTYAPAYAAVDVDYFPVTSSTYETQDGGVRIYRDLPLPGVDNTVRAQRLAKLALERARLSSTLVLPCKLTALKVATWDTVYVTLGVLGLSAATYRVIGWKLTAEDGVLGVDLTLQEETSGLYSWTASNGTDPAVPPDLSIPDAVDIGAPTSLVLTSGTSELLRGGDGTIISRIKAAFTAAVETNVWRYELQWKKSTETTWNTVYMPSDSTTYYLAPVEDGVDYNVQVRTQAVMGPVSAWLSGTHTVVGKTAPPTAPSSLGVSGAPGGFDIEWSACPDADYAATQIWESTSNDRATATQIAEISATRMARSGLLGGVTRYYWIRHVDTTGNVSSWYPASATAGVSGTTLSSGNTLQITHDSTSYLAGGATSYLNGIGYWLGYSGGAYKMHLGDPGASHIKWDGSAFTIKGTTFTGDIQVDSAGNIRGGQTAYNTGTGFWLGYTGGAYKFSIGNPSGSYFRWTGSALEASGDIVDTRPYAAGTNVIAASYLAVYIIAETTYRKYKGIRVARSGTVTVDFELVGAGAGFAAYARIYKNGVAVGTERTTTSTTWVAAADENISVAAGDTIELWAKMQNTSANGGIRNFRVMCNANLGEAVVFEGGTVIWP